MKIEFNNNTYYPNFRAIALTKTEIKQARSIINSCADSLDVITQKKYWTQLYNIFQPHIENEAKAKSGKFCAYSDVLSELKLLFFESLNSVKSDCNPIQKLILALNGAISTKNTVKAEYLNHSLDKGISKNSGEFIQAATITAKHSPVPESAISIEKHRERLAKILEDNVLTSKEKSRMTEKGKGMSMAAIAREEKVNPSVVQNSIKKGILKIQRKNGQIPAHYKEIARELAQLLNCSDEKALDSICKMPQIANLSLEKIEQNISECSSLLNWSRDEYIKLGLKMPSYFCYNRETMIINIRDCSEVMQCSYDYYFKLCQKDPTMLHLKPKTLKKYIKNKSKILGCSAPDVIKTTSRMPAFLYTKQSTMKKYIKKLMEVLKCSRAEAIELMMKQPSVMFYKKQILKTRIKEGAKTLKCTKDEFARLALKQETLLTLSSETLQTHVQETPKLLGCTPEAFIEICKTRPGFLCMNPEKIKHKSDIVSYYKRIQNKTDNKLILKFDSDETLYKRILIYLLNTTGDKKLDVTRDYKKLPEYLKARQDRSYQFTIPDDPVVKDFIEFAQDFSTKTIGKNIFEFKVA